jgi:hypothetical protein
MTFKHIIDQKLFTKVRIEISTTFKYNDNFNPGELLLAPGSLWFSFQSIY